MIRLSSSPSVGVNTTAVLRLTLAEADTNVALEPNVVLTRELEGGEDGGEHALATGILPLAKDGRIGGAPVVVGDHVVVGAAFVVVGQSHAAPGEPAVDSVRLHVHLEHEAVSDLGAADVLAVAVADPHGAGRRRSCIGNGSGSGEHADVEAGLNVLDARLVHALDAVGLRLEGHQLRVLLDHQDEVGQTIIMEETTGGKVDLEVNLVHSSLWHVDSLSAALVIAVTLDVHNAVEVAVTQVDIHQHTISQTVHREVGPGEVCG